MTEYHGSVSGRMTSDGSLLGEVARRVNRVHLTRKGKSEMKKTASETMELVLRDAPNDWFDREVVERARKRCINTCHVLTCQREGRCHSAWPGDTNFAFLALIVQEADAVYVERMNALLGVHTLHRDCGDENCIVCNGGLALCVTCGGTEVAMTSECPGRKMTADEMDAVQEGHLDYWRGQWRLSEWGSTDDEQAT